jgi:glycosyltransferase involved in cell wall biosynthesis
VRILHLIPLLSSGGAERQLRYLVEAHALRGHELHVGYVHAGSNDEGLDRWPATLHRIGISANEDPRLLLAVFRLISCVRPDIVQTWLLQMDVAGGLACMLARNTWVLREPNVEPAYTRSWKFRLRELVARRCDAIVANSADGLAYWRRKQPHKPARVIGNAIPLSAIQAAPSRLLPEFGNDLMPTVLYAGRLVSDHYSEKNVARLLNAIQIVNAEIPCRAVIAGDGPQREELMTRSWRLGISDRVIFAGRMHSTHLWGLMKSVNMFVLVSPFEGMPNSVMEAVACRCPVVLSDIPVHRELLAEDMAVFVDHKDTNAIASAIIRVLRSQEESRARANRAYSRVVDWSVDIMADRYETLYRSLSLSREKLR